MLYRRQLAILLAWPIFSNAASHSSSALTSRVDFPFDLVPKQYGISWTKTYEYTGYGPPATPAGYDLLYQPLLKGHPTETDTIKTRVFYARPTLEIEVNGIVYANGTSVGYQSYDASVTSQRYSEKASRTSEVAPSSPSPAATTVVSTVTSSHTVHVLPTTETMVHTSVVTSTQATTETSVSTTTHGTTETHLTVSTTTTTNLSTETSVIVSPTTHTATETTTHTATRTQTQTTTTSSSIFVMPTTETQTRTTTHSTTATDTMEYEPDTSTKTEVSVTTHATTETVSKGSTATNTKTIVIMSTEHTSTGVTTKTLQHRELATQNALAASPTKATTYVATVPLETNVHTVTLTIEPASGTTVHYHETNGAVILSVPYDTVTSTEVRFVTSTVYKTVEPDTTIGDILWHTKPLGLHYPKPICSKNAAAGQMVPFFGQHVASIRGARAALGSMATSLEYPRIAATLSQSSAVPHSGRQTLTPRDVAHEQVINAEVHGEMQPYDQNAPCCRNAAIGKHVHFLGNRLPAFAWRRQAVTSTATITEYPQVTSKPEPEDDESSKDAGENKDNNEGIDDEDKANEIPDELFLKRDSDGDNSDHAEHDDEWYNRAGENFYGPWDDDNEEHDDEWYNGPVARRTTTGKISSNDIVCSTSKHPPSVRRVIEGIWYLRSKVDKPDVCLDECQPSYAQGHSCVRANARPGNLTDNFSCVSTRVSCSYGTAIYVVNCNPNSPLRTTTQYVARVAEEILGACCPAGELCRAEADGLEAAKEKKLKSGGIWNHPTDGWYVDVRHTREIGSSC